MDSRKNRRDKKGRPQWSRKGRQGNSRRALRISSSSFDDRPMGNTIGQRTARKRGKKLNSFS